MLKVFSGRRANNIEGFFMRLLACIFIFCTSSSLALATTEAPPKTFLESIEFSVKNNPRIVSTNEFLESIELALKAIKADALPSGSVSCTATQSFNNASIQGAPFDESHSLSRSCGVSGSFVIFDSGVQKNTYLGAVARYEATKATFNTSDSLVPNTRGGLANETKSNYESLVSMRARIIFYGEILQTLKVFTKFSNENNLLAAIVNIEQATIQFNNAYEILQKNFEHIVTLPADENIEDLESAILSLKYPSTVEEAIDIATQRGPEVLRRNQFVKLSEFSLKAVRARLGPSVSINARVDQGSFRIQGAESFDSRSNSASVGITFRLPLDPSGKFRVQSAQKDLASKKSEREAALNEAIHSLRQTYISLQNQQRLYPELQKNFFLQKQFVQELVDKVEAGQTANLDIIKILNDINTLQSRFEGLLQLQGRVFSNLFTIQQVTGLLFEQFSIDGTQDF
jgi:outer membrane protein TolC